MIHLFNLYFFLFSLFFFIPSPSYARSFSISSLFSNLFVPSSEFIFLISYRSVLGDLYPIYLKANYFNLDKPLSFSTFCWPYYFSSSDYIDFGDTHSFGLIWLPSCDHMLSPSNLSWKVVDNHFDISSSRESYFPALNLTEADVDFLMNQVPLSSDDFPDLFRPLSVIPSSSVLPHNTWSFSTLITSSFAQSNNIANKNFTLYYDFGLTPSSSFSLFYSIADDPLNPPFLVDSSPLFLSWELYGFSFIYSLFNYPSSSFSFRTSFENWGISSYFFNNESSLYYSAPSFGNYLIGSFSLPYSLQLGESFLFTLSPGINFLPSSLHQKDSNDVPFYGTTTFVSSGFSWQPSVYLDLFAGLTVPFGNGSNFFTSDLVFFRSPVYSLGVNLNLNPRSSISVSLSNSFGSTPATNLLTTSVVDSFNYSLNFSFFPDLLDSPQLPFTERQLQLANGGLFTSSAVLPPENNFSLSIGSSTDFDLYASVGYSLSNQVLFRFYNIWFDYSGSLSSDISTAFFNDNSIGSTISTSFNFFSPLRGSPFWSSATLAFGRNSYISDTSPLGFSFLSLDNTFEFSNDFSFNINPKFVVSGFGMLYGVGLTANFPFFGEFEFIPSLNLVYDNSDFNQSNISASVFWRISDSRSLEFYISNTRSPFDIGQMQRSDFFSLGFNTRFYF